MSVGSFSPIPHHCPWGHLHHYAPPNVNWCEENLCSWIVNPANTWSNLAYIFLGMLILKMTKDQKTLRMFGPATIFVGVGSFLWHASFTFVFQFVDFLAMFAFGAVPLVLNLRRLNIIGPSNQFTVFYSYVVGMSVLLFIFYWVEIPYQSLVFVSIIAAVLMEIVLYRRGTENVGYKNLLLAAVSMGVAFGFSLADVTGVFCDPQNHIIQGHAIWHILSAASIGFWFLFYRQFNFDGVDHEMANEQ
ncbi:MAG: ceramidase [Pseudomonadales bacterium]|nr:ceramidase [Pseudomonadales bacterium]